MAVGVANMVDTASFETRLRSRQAMAVGVAAVMGATVVDKQAVAVTVDVAVGSRYAYSWGGDGNDGCSSSHHRGGSSGGGGGSNGNSLKQRGRLSVAMSRAKAKSKLAFIKN